jgi:hypothetical protein
MLSLLKRKKGTTHQQFRDYYETKHRLLGEMTVNGYALSYDRYYLYNMDGDTAEPVYDAVTQMCFPDREACVRATSAVWNDPEKTKIIVDDEAAFLDRETTLHLEARDSFSKLQILPPSDTIFRTIWMARRRDGMTRDECQAYYENKHRLLGEYMMNGYAYNYDRHYLHNMAPDAPEPPYTFVMEMNFPSAERYAEMGGKIVGDPTLSQLVAEDEARYIDRTSAVHYRAELSSSVLQPLKSVAAA